MGEIMKLNSKITNSISFIENNSKLSKELINNKENIDTLPKINFKSQSFILTSNNSNDKVMISDQRDLNLHKNCSNSSNLNNTTNTRDYLYKTESEHTKTLLNS